MHEIHIAFVQEACMTSNLFLVCLHAVFPSGVSAGLLFVAADVRPCTNSYRRLRMPLLQERGISVLIISDSLRTLMTADIARFSLYVYFLRLYFSTFHPFLANLKFSLSKHHDMRLNYANGRRISRNFNLGTLSPVTFLLFSLLLAQFSHPVLVR